MIDFTGPNQTWANALRRADQFLIRCWQRPTDHPDFQVFETTSRGDLVQPVYTVAVKADVNGIHVSCDCLGGMNGRVCLHAARVLCAMGHLPDLPEDYRGGAIRSSWGRPTRPRLDGKASLALLNGDL